VRLQVDAPCEIWLKLESLQPIGSFKLRGAGNAMLSATPEDLERGVVTTSAGNMAQGVAWMARELGVPATAIVPDHAPETKVAAIERLGGSVVRVPWDEWWSTMEAGRAEGIDALFVHPVRDLPVMAGNGTIGLELVEQLSEIDAVLVPWGGGGLTTGIASALAARSPTTKVYVCEPETGAPVTAALANGGEPAPIEYQASFVDGAGSGALLPEMWERARPLVADAFALTLAETAAAVRLLLERARVVAEGAAALTVAAAVSGRVDAKRVVCIVSGGNIDASRLREILAGRVPD
jgi:threonine dehydratase